jgi:hypothetical protein
MPQLELQQISPCAHIVSPQSSGEGVALGVGFGVGLTRSMGAVGVGSGVFSVIVEVGV